MAPNTLLALATSQFPGFTWAEWESLEIVVQVLDQEGTEISVLTSGLCHTVDFRQTWVQIPIVI